MMEPHEYYEEEELEVGEEVVVGVVAPQPVQIPLEVQVAPLAEWPESPPPAQSPKKYLPLYRLLGRINLKKMLLGSLASIQKML